ncbi:MAG: hypothetical protein ABIZ70_13910 [Gemmatimonadales bacterium]
MNLDDLKLELDRLFAARPDPREQAAGLREALVEFKIGIGQLREALQKSERELEVARREMADYERRGRMAAEIEDVETSRLAEEFTTKARERVDLLERKVIVQRDELFLAERDYDATKQQYQSASRGIPFGSTPPSASPAQDPDAGPSLNDHLVLDQRARESAVEAQLALLKKKLSEPK